MITNNFIDTAKVMSKGQVTIPKDVRKVLGIDIGDKVTFIVENGNVQIVNSAVYAMKTIQDDELSELSKKIIDKNRKAYEELAK